MWRATHRRGLSLLALFALVLVACAGEGATGPTEAGPTDDGLAGLGEAAEGEAPDESSGEDAQLTVAGGGAGSGVYLAAGTVAEWTRTRSGLDHVRMTAQTTGGLIENVRLVEGHETDMGFGASSQMFQASRGEGPFEEEEPYENLRALFPAWEASTQVVTFDPEIETIADLEGKRVNLGPPGSSSAASAEVALRAAGVWDQVEKEVQDWSEGVRLMQDNLVDAFFVAGPPPFPAVQEAVAVQDRDARFVPMDDVIPDILQEHPEQIEATVAADAYGGGVPSEDYPSVGYLAFLVAHADVPEDVVYDLMESILTDEGREYMEAGYDGFATGFANFPGFEALEQAGVKLHPGAVRYWQDQGEEVPEAVIP